MKTHIVLLTLILMVVSACNDETESPEGGADGSVDAAQDAGDDMDASDIADQQPDGANPTCDDIDGDAICDADEPGDTDRDSTPNAGDDDSDNDGIPDTTEAGDSDPETPPVDSDADGLPDVVDPDSDADGIADADEGVADTDGDGIPNYLDKDSDGDGIGDTAESGDFDLRTPPDDSDSDGVPDYLEIDSDGDRLPDAMEDANTDGELSDGETDRRLVDTDSDGSSDLVEVGVGSDPRNGAETPATMDSLGIVIPYDEAAPAPVLVGTSAPADSASPVRLSADISDQPDSEMSVDTLDFVFELRVAPLGTSECADESPLVDTDADGTNETYAAVDAGTRVCWEIEFSANSTVEFDGTVLRYGADVAFHADNVRIDSRTIFFIVPPI